MLRHRAPDAFAPRMIASDACVADSPTECESAVTVGAIVSCGCACTVSAMMALSLTNLPKNSPAPMARRSRSSWSTIGRGSLFGRPEELTRPLGWVSASCGRFASMRVVTSDIVVDTCLPMSREASPNFCWICLRSRAPQSPSAKCSMLCSSVHLTYSPFRYMRPMTLWSGPVGDERLSFSAVS
eukprot:scaffold92088_cov31-Tisochrysis_lutea.AAC.3